MMELFVKILYGFNFFMSQFPIIYKTENWFLYDGDLRDERVKPSIIFTTKFHQTSKWVLKTTLATFCKVKRTSEIVHRSLLPILLRK